MADLLHTIFGIFGNVTALFLFLAPTITFFRIIKNKSSEEFSGVPYVSTLLNCLLSAWYGLPFISANNLLMSTINGTGVVIELVYVILFLIYAPKKVKRKIFSLFIAVIVTFSAIALISVFALEGDTRRIFSGLATTVFSICMYGSPLSVMRMVIKTKSVEYMPFFLSLFVFLCGTSWFVFGLLGGDIFVYLPNGFGCFLGILQLILYAIYKDWGGKGKACDDKVHDKMENGHGNGPKKPNGQKAPPSPPASDNEKVADQGKPDQAWAKSFP